MVTAMQTGRFRVFLHCLVAAWIAAPLIIVLTMSFTSSSIPAADKAQIWMMASALLGWCLFSAAIYFSSKHLGVFEIATPVSRVTRVASFVCMATMLAMVEECFTQFMTEHAMFFGVRIGEAYITPSLSYWDTVSHHSVVVFIPMFLVCAVVSELWHFSAIEIFFLIGITGLTAEMTMNPASLFMGFWILIYGLMVLLPAKIFYRSRSAVRNWWHYPLSVILMLLGGLLASLAIHAIFPEHPDQHFKKGSNQK